MNCVTLKDLGRMPVILLVEDNVDHVLFTQMAFEEAQLQVDLQVVYDGTECMDFLNRRDVHSNAPCPDLILLDIHMPRMNGHEVLREIRADPALRQIPVIVLTTSDDQMEVERMHKLGCNSYMVKSSDFDHSVQMMGQMVGYWLNVVVLPTGVRD